jgi:hypothetical protein
MVSFFSATGTDASSGIVTYTINIIIFSYHSTLYKLYR